MNLNKIYYDLILGDEKYLDLIDYDVLVMNEIFYDDFLKQKHIELGKKEIEKGKIVFSSLKF